MVFMLEEGLKDLKLLMIYQKRKLGMDPPIILSSTVFSKKL